MKFNKKSNTLSLEKKDCTTCTHGAGGQGQYTGYKVCGTCNGTGNGVRGGKGKCKPCFGRGKEHDFDNPIVCPTCNGNYKDFSLETFCDVAPSEVVESLPLKIVRLDRDNTWNESYLVMGTLFSVTDYGAMSELDDDAALAEAKSRIKTDWTQATKITRYERGDVEASVCDFLVVAITRNGWSVRPWWED